MEEILLICTDFFDYYKDIIAEYERQGYKVHYYNDRPYKNSFLVGFQKLNKKMMTIFINKYFEKICNETMNLKLDYIIFINSKTFNEYQIKHLKNLHSKSKFILYMWDSLMNYPGTESQLVFFDKVLSFDIQDSRNEKIIYLPLFYTQELENHSKVNVQYKISSIFTAHPNRFQRIYLFENEIQKFDIELFLYPYINILQFLFYCLTDSRISIKHLFKLKFRPLSRNEYNKVLFKSDIIFDIPHEGQTGLTMRVFESIGAKKKLITSNSNIQYFDFYNKNNIYILGDSIDSEDFEEFLNTEYEDLDNDIYFKYSITNWAINVIK